MTEPLAALASIDELAARVGTIPTEDRSRAHACLLDASNLVRGEGSSSWTPDTVPGQVITIVLAVAARVFRNPDGVQSTSVGGVSESYSPATLGAYLLTSERDTVRRAAGRTGIGVLKVRRPPEPDETVYSPVVGTDEPVPYARGDWR